MKPLTYLAMSALLIAGCSSSQTSREDTNPAPAATSGTETEGMRADMEGMCPMQVEGTAVSAEDVEGGVALTFTTSSDVVELRRRVAHMAKMHGQHGMEMHAPAGAGDGHADGGQRSDASQHQSGMMSGGMMMPAATARSEEVEGGARIVITPQDAADLEKVREHARHMTERMSSGQCLTVAMQGEAAEPPPASSEDHESHHPEGNTELYSSEGTPRVVKRVHELYEELGRQDVRAAQAWDDAERERRSTEAKADPAREGSANPEPGVRP